MKKQQGEEISLPPDVVINNFYVNALEVRGKFVADTYVLKIGAHNKHSREEKGTVYNGFYDREYKEEVLKRRCAILRVIGDNKDMVVRVSYLTLMLGLNFRPIMNGKHLLAYTGSTRSAVVEYLGSIRGEFSIIPCRDVRGLRVPFGFPRTRPVPWFLRLHAALFFRNSVIADNCQLCDGRRPLIHGFRNDTGRFYGDCFVHDLCAVLNALHRAPPGVQDFPLIFKCDCGQRHTFDSDSKMFPVMMRHHVVGTNVGGMHASLKKLTRNAIVHPKCSQLVYKAIAMMYRGCGVTYHKFALPIPDMFDPVNYMHDYPQTKGGALMMRHVKCRTEDGVYVGNFMNPYRSEAANTAAFVSVGVAHYAYNELVHGVGPAIRSLNENIMSPLKTAFKSEVKEGINPRVFQVASIFDLSIEKVIFTPLQKIFSGRFPFMVGFRWTHRGAHQIAQYMSYDQSDVYRWADYDISGLDVDLLAPIIVVLMNSLFGFFHIGIDEMKEELQRSYEGLSDVNAKKLVVFYLLYSKMVQNYTGKVITFPDFFRVVVGGMSSGQLNTSFFDTLYCIIMVYAWMLHCASLLPEHLRSIWVRRNLIDLHFLIYGDDGLIRFRRDSGLHVLEKNNTEKVFPSYQSFLKAQFSLTIKVEESGEYDRFLTEVSKEGEAAIPGPKILQRYFVWDEQYKVVAPLRVTSRAAPRLLCDQSEFEDDDAFRFQMLRILGHMYDCSGTNFYYYNMLKQMHSSIANLLHKKGVACMPADDSVQKKFVLVWESKIFQIIGRDKELAGRMIEASGLLNIPSFDEIGALFNAEDKPQERYSDAEEIMARIGEYQIIDH